LNSSPFYEFVGKNLVLIDGAMGTYIYQRGVYIDKCFDALNLSDPGLIESIHREYTDAGAHVIETNTFGANRYKLKKHNLVDQLEEINLRGVEIARKVAGDGFVAGSMGPLGIKIAPWGELSREMTRKAFREQAEALFKGGVDLFIIETFQNLVELEQAVLAVREVSDLPVIAQMAFQEDGRTLYGVTIEEMAARLNALPVEVIGLNCVLGPKLMLDTLERLVHFTEKPISIIPNAGLPQLVDGRMIYMSTPDYFSVYTSRFIQCGAKIVGGCCGTTPEHIQRMAEAIAQKQTRSRRSFDVKSPVPQDLILPDPVPLFEKSGLAKKISASSFVTLVEMTSPRGLELSKQIDGAKKLRAFGIDAVNIPDGPRASARLNGLAMAVKLQEQVQIETVLHYTCRDINLFGIQSDLLGAALLGIHNILAITGDPPKMGDYPDATAVFDIDSIGLTRFISNLNLGLDIGNKPIGPPTAFLVGVGVDPSAVNLSVEIERYRQKIDAGAEFVITQPVFDLGAFEYFLNHTKGVSIPLIAGVWPLISLRNAEFMKHEVPGVVIPDQVIQRIGQFDSKDDQLKAGIEIACEMAVQIKDFAQGIQVSAPFGRVQIAMEIVKCVQ
jgi:methionine synthase I (cobalamin-dependent)/5,10-methylenetetrahydrofolate reductase